MDRTVDDILLRIEITAPAFMTVFFKKGYNLAILLHVVQSKFQNAAETYERCLQLEKVASNNVYMTDLLSVIFAPICQDKY